MTNLKLSQITNAVGPPVSADKFVGVMGGTNDVLYSLAQLAAGVSSGVNVATFPGVDRTGVTDSTAGIQAAIDFCFAHPPSRTIFIPGGKYKTSLPIFVDPPDGLRGIGFYTPWSSGTTYAQGDIALFNGIPWMSQVAGNINNTPFLPPKIDFIAYAINSIVEWQGKYWKASAGTTGGAFPTNWVQQTIFWLPTASPDSTDSQWAPAFIGETGVGSGSNAYGVILFPTFNNAVALWSACGNGNMISSIQITGPLGLGDGFAYRHGQPATGVAIGIPCGSGGASRTLIENCTVLNFYNGVKTGVVGVALGDSNTIRRLETHNCGNGIYFSQQQNFVDQVHDCTLGYCHVAVACPVNTGALILGGNFGSEAAISLAMAISGTTAVVGTDNGPPTGANYPWHFTTVVVPDANNYLAAGVLDYFFMVTAHFGVIPLQSTGFNPATNVLTLVFDTRYANAHWTPQFDMFAHTKIQDDLLAVTKLYASEVTTTLFGGGIVAEGIFIENQIAPNCLIHSASGAGGGRPNFVRGIITNGDPTYYQYAPNVTSDDTANARYYAATLTPFVACESVDTVLEGIQFQSLSAERLQIYISGARLIVQNCTDFQANFAIAGADWNAFFQNINTPVLGGSIGDVNPFRRCNAVTDTFEALAEAPQWGVRPAPYTRPGLPSSYLDILEGTLPAITNDAGAPTAINFTLHYPMLWGGQPYTVISQTGLNPPSAVSYSSYGVIPLHRCYSYGQNLTTTNVPNLAWTIKGGSQFVYANQEVLRLLFPGLGVVLNNGSSDIFCMVLEVFPAQGYFRIQADVNAIGSFNAQFGSSTTITTGTLIKQDPYSFRRIDVAPNTNLQTPVTGFSITIGNFDTQVILNPAGTLATGTLIMCPVPFDNQVIRIRSTQAITALTITPNSGQSVLGAPTSLAAGQITEAVYNKASTTWYF